MTNRRMIILVLIIAGALWALFMAAPQAGRAAILVFIVGLPFWLMAAGSLAKMAKRRGAQ